LEAENMLCLNNGPNGVAQGSFGFTNDLPAEGFDPDHIRLKDLWFYMDSQETVGISPQAYHEFFYPYYAKIAAKFGLLSYGCCEAVHDFWKDSVSKYHNLRKVSISAWCNEEYIGDELRGKKIIYHRKPAPQFIGVGKDFDADGFAEHIKKTLACAKGCTLEFSFRDVYTLCGDIERPRKAVKIIRDLTENYY